MIEIYANSCKEDKELMKSLSSEGLRPHSIHKFGRAPFFVVFPGHKAMIEDLESEGWLYYPTVLSKALSDRGIDNCVYCHSGLEVINGEYVYPEIKEETRIKNLLIPLAQSPDAAKALKSALQITAGDEE